MNKKAEPAAEPGVHTSAPADTPVAQEQKPKLHQPTELPPPDQYHGVAGTYVRDPVTGVRTPVEGQNLSPFQ